MAEDLAQCLRNAKSKNQFFAFIPKGMDGKLLLSKKKIPQKEITDAKSELKGGPPVTGKCSGQLSNLIFLVKKAPSDAVANAIKKVVKRDAELVVSVSFQEAGDADSDEEDTGKAPAAPSAGGAPGGAPPAPAAGNGTAAPAAAAASLDYGPWNAARQTAIHDVMELASKVTDTGHETAPGVLGEINRIVNRIKKLPQQPSLDQIPALLKQIDADDDMKAAEEVPSHFHKLEIRKPLIAELEKLQK